jgi:hypothetical protein
MVWYVGASSNLHRKKTKKQRVSTALLFLRQNVQCSTTLIPIQFLRAPNGHFIMVLEAFLSQMNSVQLGLSE